MNSKEGCSIQLEYCTSLDHFHLPKRAYIVTFELYSKKQKPLVLLGMNKVDELNC